MQHVVVFHPASLLVDATIAYENLAKELFLFACLRFNAVANVTYFEFL